MRNIYSYLIALSIVRNIELKNEDIIFSYWLSRATVIAYILNQITDTKFICQGHGSDIYIHPPKNLEEIIKKCKYVLTISEKNKEYLVERFKVPSDKIKVFRLGVSIDFYNKLKNKNIEKANNKTEFISVSGYIKVKGVDLLLKSIEYLVYEKTLKIYTLKFLVRENYTKN